MIVKPKFRSYVAYVWILLTFLFGGNNIVTDNHRCLLLSTYFGDFGYTCFTKRLVNLHSVNYMENNVCQYKIT